MREPDGGTLNRDEVIEELASALTDGRLWVCYLTDVDGRTLIRTPRASLEEAKHRLKALHTALGIIIQEGVH